MTFSAVEKLLDQGTLVVGFNVAAKQTVMPTTTSSHRRSRW